MSRGSDTAWRPPTPAAQPPESVEGYADLVEIGRGGDSVVYRARQLALNREVAIKVLAVDDETRSARFQREVEITMELGRQHPNIVNLLDIATTASGRPCIVMDYYQGGTLQDRLRTHGPLPVDEVVSIGVVLADALAFAHERGVLHRDVKPQNVLVLPTSWVLADFGIARLVDTEHTASADTFTYRHAAPQILDGYPPTAADDIWSLGSTLFTLIDGRPPFASADPDDDTALAYLRRARTEPHRRLLAAGAERIGAIIDRCLAKEVADRWASAAELRDALAGERSTAWLPGSRAAAPGSAPAGAAPPAVPMPPTPVSPEEARWAPAAVGDRIEESPAPRPVTTPPPISGAPMQAPPIPAPPIQAPPIQAPPGDPEPVALSVLAHSPEPVDVEPTGVARGLIAPPPSAPRVPRVPPAPAPGGGRRRRALLILGAVALVVGLVLGIGASVLRNRGNDAPTATSSKDGRPVRSLTAAPTQTGDPQVPKPDRKLRFVIKDLRFNGAGIEITWTDPADGKAVLFYLEKTLPKRPVVKRTFDGGTTQATLPMFVKPGVRYCFAMTVHVQTGEIGTAPTRCLKVSG